MYYVLNGLILALFGLALRAFIYKDRKITVDAGYFWLLCISFAGSLLGVVGFSQLIQLPLETQGADYSQLITVLSLLAAAVVVGFFNTSYTTVAADERLRPAIVSGSFTVLLYLAFGAISYYIGQSANAHNALHVATIVPLVMWAILVVNALVDFLAYRDSK